MESRDLLVVIPDARRDHALRTSVMADAAEALLGSAPALRRHGWTLRPLRRMQADSASWRRGDLALIRLVSRGSLLRSSGIVALDVFVKYRHGNDVWWAIPTRDAGHACRVPAAFYAQLEPRGLAERVFGAPSPAEGYLTWIYGDFRIPRPDHHPLRDDRSIVGRAW